ncbi:class I SAM-dependent methyltransferase [Bradyrhizobium sp. sGM-13]|uniref:class I SAM-dependent methyltransferase n=1 Tax=Bradyrhizobium sp. sGM-13 TaxID=2831781 RepID=UPI001BCFEA48|nr:class I SAM-dependent methyltransferase [Bradyrhizobium sp. sGM-13]
MSETWDQTDGIRQRQYRNYQEYCEHQVSKLATLDLSRYSTQFRSALAKRIDALSALPRGSTVLCLGARNGAECEVFIENGFFAVGVDLNPGPNNQTVLTGDFHHLQFADGTVDVVFSNALDHAFDFKEVMSEIRRVLKPTGLFVAEIVRGSKDADGREPGAYESVWWDYVDEVVTRIQKHEFRMLKRTRFSYPWNGDQCIFEQGNR